MTARTRNGNPSKRGDTRDHFRRLRHIASDAVFAGGDSDDQYNAPATILWGNRLGQFNQRTPTPLPREAGCKVTLDVYLRGSDLYALRECNMYNGYAVQRISVPGLSSVLVADGKTSGYWFSWIWNAGTTLLLVNPQRTIRFNP